MKKERKKSLQEKIRGERKGERSAIGDKRKKKARKTSKGR